MKPLITIILPLLDGSVDALEIIKSLLGQTYTNHELIVISNEAIDPEVLQLSDRRLRLFYDKKKAEKYSIYNEGINLAQGKYICFIEVGESAMQNRLKFQFDYMEENIDIGCFAGGSQIVDGFGVLMNVSKQTLSHEMIKTTFLRENCLKYSPLFFRMSCLLKNNLTFDANLGNAAKYDFVVRAARSFPIIAVDTILVNYKVHRDEVFPTAIEKHTNVNDLIRHKQIKELGIRATNKELYLHDQIMNGFQLSSDELAKGIKWFNKLIMANGKKNLYEPSVLKAFLEKILIIKFKRIEERYTVGQSLSRTDIINLYIQKFFYTSYLEIGVNNPELNFDYIKCDKKIGVDPVPLRTDIIGLTSDQYFNQLSSEEKFDLIFIDGLHHCEQVLQDILNSLKHLNKTGTIICHDMLPTEESMQKVPRETNVWTGDCWKAFAYLRMTRKDLQMSTIDTDYGVGIIKIGSQKQFIPTKDMSALDYAFFHTNKQKLMNVTDKSFFFSRIK